MENVVKEGLGTRLFIMTIIPIYLSGFKGYVFSQHDFASCMHMDQSFHSFKEQIFPIVYILFQSMENYPTHIYLSRTMQYRL